MTNVSADIVNRALAKLQARQTYVNVAAVYIGDATDPGQDGVTWLLYVTDGVESGDVIKATVAGTYGGRHGMAIDEDKMEQTIERRASNFAVETRLRDMLAASPLTIELDDVLPDDEDEDDA
jgi:hypothetical protein